MLLKLAGGPLAIGLLPCGIAAMALAQPLSECPALEDPGRNALIGYVRKVYKVAPTTPVDLAEVRFVGGSCFRELHFRSTDPRKPFQATLFASPDLHFLTNQLLDTRTDPGEEERRQRRAIADKLSRISAPVFGAREAPVVVAVFSDFQCPFCSQAAKGLTQEIVPGSGGAVRLEYHYFPLPIHSWARRAAEVAACAREQGDSYFWAMHDYLFAQQKEIKPDTLERAAVEHAEGLPGFDTRGLKACLDGREATSTIEEDLALARELGVTATPTMFVNGERVVGYRTDQIRSLIEHEAPREQDINGRQVK